MIEALFSDSNYVAQKKLMDATVLRHEALAANIANVETPGYKRIDLPKNFNDEFAARLRAGEPQTMAMPAPVEDHEATSQRPDGNNVELDKELLTMSGNSMQFETLGEFVSESLRQLRLAITGRES
jgi:flagellar basal-body rod protein FlgB